MNTLSTQKELRLLRNKDNNLNEKQCKALIKNYKKYMNGKISEINHPKTRHQIKNPSKIAYPGARQPAQLGLNIMTNANTKPPMAPPNINAVAVANVSGL